MIRGCCPPRRPRARRYRAPPDRAGRARPDRPRRRISRLASGSLRSSGAMLRTVTPASCRSRSRMPSPVVPASPSMKTVAFRWSLRRCVRGHGRHGVRPWLVCPVDRLSEHKSRAGHVGSKTKKAALEARLAVQAPIAVIALAQTERMNGVGGRLRESFITAFYVPSSRGMSMPSPLPAQKRRPGGRLLNPI